MGYASRAGRARTQSNGPQAHAICDRCGFRYNHVDLMWQYDWRGTTQMNIRVLVCSRCLDAPQEQLRAIAIPADPTPIIQPRVQDFVLAQGTNNPVLGAPEGLNQNAIMPLQEGNQYAVPLSPLSVISTGSTTVSVTFSAPHGLSTGNQISVNGLSQSLACGFFSVNVTGAMGFTYQTKNPVPAGSLLTSTTRMVTAIVGLPYGVTTIPQV